MFGGPPTGGAQALRLLAWSWVPKRVTGKTHELEEPYDCDVVCRRVNGDGSFDDAARASRGCCRIDLPAVPWDVKPSLIRRAYMGRRPMPGVSEEEGQRISWRAPLERPSDGCPGGWYRSRFVWSLARYLRERVEGGQRVPNPLLDRCSDDFVLLCERIFVQEQERAASHRIEAMQP